MQKSDAQRAIWRGAIETFLVGVIGILPLAITFSVLAWLVKLLHDLVGPQSVVGKGLRNLGMTITACEVTAYVLGVLATVALIYGIGLMIVSGAGHRWHATVDASIKRLPMLSTVYDASKNLTRLFDRKNSNVQGMTPVMCQFGDDGAAAVPALMPTPEIVRFDGNDYHMVIIPSAPVPFGGALVCVKTKWVKPALCSIDELIGVYMSMGASAPGCLGADKMATARDSNPIQTS